MPEAGAAAATPLRLYHGGEYVDVVRFDRPRGGTGVLIKVHPDCRVEAHAPSHIGKVEVLRALKLRAAWVWKKLRHFRALNRYARPRHYVSGESHLYLGRRYLLKVNGAASDRPGVKLFRGRLEVTTADRRMETVRRLLRQWYRERARDVFGQRLDVLLADAQWLTVRPALRLQFTAKQWGSCSPQGVLTLNPHLIKAPRDCIDYVLLHELCHMLERNHSRHFYRLLETVMPHWPRVKARLDNLAPLLLA